MRLDPYCHFCFEDVVVTNQDNLEGVCPRCGKVAYRTSAIYIHRRIVEEAIRSERNCGGVPQDDYEEDDVRLPEMWLERLPRTVERTMEPAGRRTRRDDHTESEGPKEWWEGGEHRDHF